MHQSLASCQVATSLQSCLDWAAAPAAAVAVVVVWSAVMLVSLSLSVPAGPVVEPLSPRGRRREVSGEPAGHVEQHVDLGQRAHRQPR